MDKRSFESGIDTFALNVLEKEGEVERFYNLNPLKDGTPITVLERLENIGKLVKYNENIKQVYSYSKRMRVGWQYRPDLAVNMLIVISKSKSSNGYIMEELTL